MNDNRYLAIEIIEDLRKIIEEWRELGKDPQYKYFTECADRIEESLNLSELNVDVKSQLEEQTAINALLESQIMQTIMGERSADKEVERLWGKVCRLESELIRTDDRWVARLREQSKHHDLRTRSIIKQLEVVSTMMADHRKELSHLCNQWTYGHIGPKKG